MRYVLMLPVLLLLAAGCGHETSAVPTAAAPVPVEIMRVQVAQVPATFEAGGIVRARTTAEVASRVLAPVVAIHVRPGDRVRRGAVLVTLEAGEMTAARDRSQASFEAGTESIHAADATVRSAEAALVLASATHDRIRTLHGKRSATTQELDQATAALEGARAQVASAQAGLAAAIASRAAARSGLDAASAALGYATLTAPFDGLVTERAVDPGDMAVPGTRLLTLEAPGAARLEVTLDEARATAASASQPVRVALREAAGERWVDAVVSEIARVDAGSHQFVVKIDLPATALPPSGAFGRARFSGPTRPGLFIPSSAAIRRGQLTFVDLVDSESRVRLQPIQPGAETGDRLEVLAGLREGDRVVVRPPASLADGATVTEGRR